MANDWTHAVMTFLQLAGNNPICPVRHWILVIGFCPCFSLVAWWSLSVSCESSHTPSHLVAILLNGTWLAPTVTSAVGTFFFLRNRASLDLPWSEATPLPAAHSIQAVVAAESLSATTISSVSSAHQPMSSTKDRP